MIDFMVMLQEYRTPLLSKIVELITITAEETTLIVVMCIILWCVNKKIGYKIGLSIILASATNAALKLMFNVERPWVKDDRIIPIRQETATGSSFPSGHTQSGAAMWFSLNRSFKNTAFRIISILMMVLIAISRVYLSVHTPMDVVGALILSVIIVLLAHYIMNIAIDKNNIIPLVIVSALAVVGLFFYKDESYYKMAGILIAYLIKGIFY